MLPARPQAVRAEPSQSSAAVVSGGRLVGGPLVQNKAKSSGEPHAQGPRELDIALFVGAARHVPTIRKIRSQMSCVWPGTATGVTGRSPISYLAGVRSSLEAFRAQSHFMARPV